ncbi:MPN527 family putative ECF transporter permease subunit [Mesomycoplasma neurolyticum]|uniref:MPN527 family putative ECF transporter permease subunit n=1 Tax=Mesomycoplasma neurolyticum TaxID=2120 RepID=UPI0038CC1612
MSYNKNIIHKITLTGILTCLSLIGIFISKFIPWPLFSIIGLKIDISFLFIFVIFFVTDFKFGIIALITRFLLGPFITMNFDLIGWLGHGILLFSNGFFIFIFFLSLFLLKKIKKLNKKIIFLIASFLSIITTSLIMTILNFLFFSPLFFGMYKITDGYFLDSTLNKWTKISNYFKTNLSFINFCFILYLPFNFTNFTLTILFSALLNKIIDNKRNKKLGKH